jgi:hypothetical protein
MARIRGASGFAALGALLAAACSDNPQSTAPNTAEMAPQQAVQAPVPSQTALARAIPEFGGLYVDGNGVPTVYLTDVTKKDLAVRALGSFSRAQGLAPAQLQVVRGDYTYGQLSDWFARISPEALALTGVVFADLDEANNRVLVGVEHAAAAASVRGVAARLGIPAAALTVRETEPIEFAATLQNLVRPVVAGLQINFGNYLCSIGYNAVHNGENSFITASHCTNKQGGTEGTLYYQPLASTANSFIGTEVDDPVYFRGGVCPRGKKCRYSDASRAAYAAGVNFTLGGIAQTTGANNGSLTIAGTFSITADDPSGGLVGQTANKVGRTSGWSSGPITNTCVNTGVSGTNIVQLCQTFVSATVAGGDSGSDVFRVSSGSNVTLLGNLWGGNQSGTQFVFSPFGQVQQELGTLVTH